MDYKVGYYAVSKSGHDKGKCYIINRIEEDYVYLVNGVTKKTESPKKKKKMHIQVECSIDRKIEQKLSNNCKITDDDISEALYRHLK
jgi:ribosomal protein L14E/L6E/L27E